MCFQVIILLLTHFSATMLGYDEAEHYIKENLYLGGLYNAHLLACAVCNKHLFPNEQVISQFRHSESSDAAERMLKPNLKTFIKCESLYCKRLIHAVCQIKAVREDKRTEGYFKMQRSKKVKCKACELPFYWNRNAMVSSIHRQLIEGIENKMPIAIVFDYLSCEYIEALDAIRPASDLCHKMLANLREISFPGNSLLISAINAYLACCCQWCTYEELFNCLTEFVAQKKFYETAIKVRFFTKIETKFLLTPISVSEMEEYIIGLAKAIAVQNHASLARLFKPIMKLYLHLKPSKAEMHSFISRLIFSQESYVLCAFPSVPYYFYELQDFVQVFAIIFKKLLNGQYIDALEGNNDILEHEMRFLVNCCKATSKQLVQTVNFLLKKYSESKSMSLYKDGRTTEFYCHKAIIPVLKDFKQKTGKIHWSIYDTMLRILFTEAAKLADPLKYMVILNSLQANEKMYGLAKDRHPFMAAYIGQPANSNVFLEFSIRNLCWEKNFEVIGILLKCTTNMKQFRIFQAFVPNEIFCVILKAIVEKIPEFISYEIQEYVTGYMMEHADDVSYIACLEAIRKQPVGYLNVLPATLCALVESYVTSNRVWDAGMMLLSVEDNNLLENISKDSIFKWCESIKIDNILNVLYQSFGENRDNKKMFFIGRYFSEILEYLDNSIEGSQCLEYKLSTVSYLFAFAVHGRGMSEIIPYLKGILAARHPYHYINIFIYSLRSWIQKEYLICELIKMLPGKINCYLGSEPLTHLKNKQKDILRRCPSLSTGKRQNPSVFLATMQEYSHVDLLTVHSLAKIQEITSSTAGFECVIRLNSVLKNIISIPCEIVDLLVKAI
ncbi:hypothetical protein ENBRE01_1083 [Enteropsectra breve]|nr:hypothetical protein ENBRE01_1083 [Enteropsectra breve]